jgi:hypothetical protein
MDKLLSETSDILEEFLMNDNVSGEDCAVSEACNKCLNFLLDALRNPELCKDTIQQPETQQNTSSLVLKDVLSQKVEAFTNKVKVWQCDLDKRQSRQEETLDEKLKNIDSKLGMLQDEFNTYKDTDNALKSLQIELSKWQSDQESIFNNFREQIEAKIYNPTGHNFREQIEAKIPNPRNRFDLIASLRQRRHLSRTTLNPSNSPFNRQPRPITSLNWPNAPSEEFWEDELKAEYRE